MAETPTIRIVADGTTIGIDDVQFKFIRRLKSAFTGIIAQNIKPIDIANEIKSDIQSLMRLPKTGKIYYRKKGVHQASAPGEAPAIEEGTLYDSIKTQSKGSLKASVTVRTPYVLALEFGNPRRNLEPRPYVRPAIIEAARKGAGILASGRAREPF